VIILSEALTDNILSQDELNWKVSDDPGASFATEPTDTKGKGSSSRLASTLRSRNNLIDIS